MHLLLIEDDLDLDLDLGRALSQALRAEGFSVEWLRRLADVPPQLTGESIGCVLLDVNLPDGSGLDQLVRWRSKDVAVPIIVIRARTALEDRPRGLDCRAPNFSRPSRLAALAWSAAPAEAIAACSPAARAWLQQAGGTHTASCGA